MCLTTICGGLCQTQLYDAVHNLFNVRSRMHWGPQNKNELCKTTTPGSSCPTLSQTVWVLQCSTLILKLVRRDLWLIALIREDLKV